VTLLFQAGYLTIASTRWRRSRLLYWLRLPNQEVKMALADHLIDAYLGSLPGGRDAQQDALYGCLSQGDLPGLIAAIRRLFAGIPWQNFTHNDLPEAEGYYASVLYAFFASLNAGIIPEDVSNHGQVDLTVKLAGYIYVIEIKVRRGPSQAGRRVEDLAETTTRGGGKTAMPTLPTLPTIRPWPRSSPGAIAPNIAASQPRACSRSAWSSTARRAIWPRRIGAP
jgi:hypothetical protein